MQYTVRLHSLFLEAAGALARRLTRRSEVVERSRLPPHPALRSFPRSVGWGLSAETRSSLFLFRLKLGLGLQSALVGDDQPIKDELARRISLKPHLRLL